MPDLFYPIAGIAVGAVLLVGLLAARRWAVRRRQTEEIFTFLAPDDLDRRP